MSRINNAFKNQKTFIGFITGGDPGVDKSVEFILEMERAGADIIEIGIPFSDPIAEGEVIQAANIRALNSGTTVHKIFGLVRKVREKSEIPLVLLTYLNPVYHMGYQNFFEQCRSSGVDGIIIPDLPFEESREVGEVAEKYGVDLISLIAPTSKERIEMISRESRGFLYVVSSMGVTGVRSEIETDIETIVREIRKTSDIPVAIGFGISTQEQAAKFASVADGVIVGSAIVRIIAEHGEDAGQYIYEYVRGIKAVL
ncbi:MAG: tryptophan synthase subunit alpha [Oscillospiraceae bacterium]|nr:tryptophan synthase subunit alpha [Oscillospiraceae bacterium]